MFDRRQRDIVRAAAITAAAPAASANTKTRCGRVHAQTGHATHSRARMLHAAMRNRGQIYRAPPNDDSNEADTHSIVGGGVGEYNGPSTRISIARRASDAG